MVILRSQWSETIDLEKLGLHLNRLSDSRGRRDILLEGSSIEFSSELLVLLSQLFGTLV